MNLYLLFQDANSGYDTYDSVVVAAETEEEARTIHPSDRSYDELRDKWYIERYDGSKSYEGYYTTWAYTKDQVKVEYLGVAKEGTKAGVILASFNAG